MVIWVVFDIKELHLKKGFLVINAIMLGVIPFYLVVYLMITKKHRSGTGYSKKYLLFTNPWVILGMLISITIIIAIKNHIYYSKIVFLDQEEILDFIATNQEYELNIDEDVKEESKFSGYYSAYYSFQNVLSYIEGREGKIKDLYSISFHNEGSRFVLFHLKTNGQKASKEILDHMSSTAIPAPKRMLPWEFFPKSKYVMFYNFTYGSYPYTHIWYYKDQLVIIISEIADEGKVLVERINDYEKTKKNE